MGQGWAVYKAFKSLRKGLSPSSRVAPKALLAPGISAITRAQVVTLPPYLVPTHGDEGEPVRSGPSAARTVTERDRLHDSSDRIGPGPPGGLCVRLRPGDDDAHHRFRSASTGPDPA